MIASDDIEQAQFTTPMLTTVHLPKEDMGKFALWLLLDRINNGHKAVTRMELECKTDGAEQLYVCPGEWVE